MKKYILGLAALFAAVTMVAFTAPETNKSAKATVYYRYKLSDHTLVNLKTAGNWEVSAPPNCAGSNYVCKIEIDDTQNLQTFLNGISAEGDFQSMGVARGKKN